MKAVLAISGGVDSMVMLDMICRSPRYASDDIIVAHFDHGIRDNSAEDAEFVRRKAGEYGVEFRLGEGRLSESASEAEARAARYDFLRNVEPLATILTAHHLDDLVESVIINLTRGTGWRGLAPLDIPNVRRPFLETEMFYEPLDRAAIMEYAAKRRLEFREDPSNSWDEYLRNRIRHQMNNNPLDFGQKMEIYDLWLKQKKIEKEIDELINELLPAEGEPWRRGWFEELEGKVALELLRAGALRAGISATRPQLENFRQAILTYEAGKSFNLPQDKLVKLGKTEFYL